jgi:hypothetical protein
MSDMQILLIAHEIIVGEGFIILIIFLIRELMK